MTAPRRILLEVCVASADDAAVASAAGADRLELNAALALGGLTPSLGTIVEARQATALPLIVMIRPRPGGFCYSEREFRILRRDVDFALSNGADGIAFGVLTESGEIDERVRQVVRQVGSKQVVFHRAFDVTPDPFAALEALIDLGVRRVMTSGQEETAPQGAPLIRQLLDRAAGRIEILPAAGINRLSVADLVARTGCDQVHASLRASWPDPSTSARPQVRFGSASNPPDNRFDATSAELVRQMRSMLDSH
jgi:copper homeostasis protein